MKLRKSDFGLNTVLSDIPNIAHALGGLSVPTDINSLDISLSGTVGGKGFMRNPTSCGTKTTNFTADSYARPEPARSPGRRRTRPMNCAALPFSPTSSVELADAGPHRSRADHPPVTTAIHQDAGQAGLRNAQVLLPPSVDADISPLVNQCPLGAVPGRRDGVPGATRWSARRPAISPFLPGALERARW